MVFTEIPERRGRNVVVYRRIEGIGRESERVRKVRYLLLWLAARSV